MRAWPVLLALLALLAAMAQAPPQSAARVTTSARALQPGDVVEFTITTAKPGYSVHLDVFDRTWPTFQVDGTTWRTLVGIDLDTPPRTYTAVIVLSAGVGPPARVTRRLSIVAKSFGTRTLTVDDSFVNPPADVAARIASESSRLAELWKREPTPRAWSGPFSVPVPEPANSAFGKRSVFNGQVRNAHTGADFPSPAGAIVSAPNAGTVVLAEDLYFSGNTVIVDHGLGMFSTFAHLSEIGVRAGEVLAPRHVIGKVGATGRVTGPHLHWAVRLNGARVDPLSLVWVTAKQAPGK
jgi:murein DD-endopeptidase MepM/ murein hydrolase activator NlpD